MKYQALHMKTKLFLLGAVVIYKTPFQTQLSHCMYKIAERCSVGDHFWLFKVFCLFLSIRI